MASDTGDGRRRTLYALASGNFAQFGTRILISALVPFILLEFETTKAGIGLALTGMWAIYALCQFPSGILADQYGERQLLLLGLTGATAGLVFVALAPSLVAFALCLLLLGAGAGLYYPPASVLVTRLYEDHGSSISILAAFGTLAGLVYPAIGGLAAEHFGWRPVLALAALFTVGVIGTIARVVPRVPPVNDDGLRDSIKLTEYRNLLTRPPLLYTIVLAITFIFTFQGLSSFYPTFLVEYHGIDRGIAGAILGGVLGVSSVAQPIAGRLSDTFSRDSALVVSIALIVTSLAVLLGVQSVVGAMVGSFVLGTGLSFPGPLQARFIDRLDEAERGYGFGLVRTVYMFGGASGSVVVGTLADTSGWVTAYGVVAACLVGCLVLFGVNRLGAFDL
ncbi:MFS transporter [Halorarius litoreus]|uniref:MFS transporter n=1 Tax=Halorarius litoreus TaxID=2962676 RepID=UPI0020CCD3A7|nr:MFS transporter [Halorarius litoreus]